MNRQFREDVIQKTEIYMQRYLNSLENSVH